MRKGLIATVCRTVWLNTTRISTGIINTLSNTDPCTRPAFLVVSSSARHQDIDSFYLHHRFCRKYKIHCFSPLRKRPGSELHSFYLHSKQ